MHVSIRFGTVNFKYLPLHASRTIACERTLHPTLAHEQSCLPSHIFTTYPADEHFTFSQTFTIPPSTVCMHSLFKACRCSLFSF